jgi:hypothetical protein
MAKAAPSITSPSTPAVDRRSQASRARTAVRTQLAQSRRRRHELSQALCALRRELREFRSQVRMRLREKGQEVATRRTPSPKAVGPVPPPVGAQSPVAATVAGPVGRVQETR